MVYGASNFRYSVFPEMGIIINYYIKNYDKLQAHNYINLYSFITSIINSRFSNSGTEISQENYLNNIIEKFFRHLDSITYDDYFIESINMKLGRFYYDFIIILGEYDYASRIANESFREWCEKWQNIYSKHTHKEKSIRNVIYPFQKKFLKRLWDPHTNIGFGFAEKNMNKIEWNSNGELKFM